MESQADDYISALNSQYDELLRAHGEPLQRKNVHSKHDLIQVIKLDLDKLTHGLVELQDTAAADVLQDFFSDSAMDVADVDRRLQQPYINHVGFEIYEPLDLTVFGIQRWIELSRATLGANIKIQTSLRFPASAAFQQRVGAYTEILRIGLRVNDRMLMLELFDISRPLDEVLLAGRHNPTHRNFHGLFSDEHAPPGHRQRLAQLFASDRIWHYAFHVRHPTDVVALHAQLLALAASNAGFSVPYEQPIHNRHDRSFHTKVISHATQMRARMEIEFVTEYVESAAHGSTF